jgi:Protein of unknown function (DUF3108)
MEAAAAGVLRGMSLSARARLLVAAAMLLLAAPSLRADPLAGPIELHYDVYGGGFRLLSLSIAVEQSAAAYRVVGSFRTRGIADLFASLTMRAETQGRIADGVPLPTRHRVDGTSRGRERHLSIEFLPRQEPLVEIDPPDPEKRTPIPPGQLVGTVDTMTGLLQLSRALAAGGDCARRVPVFDGRRRFDLVLTDLGTRELKRSGYSFYEGPAHLCHVRQERIGGFVLHDTEDKNRADQGDVWIAAVLPDTLPVPVRIEFNSGWGRSILHLVEIRAPTGYRRVS